MGGHGNVHEDLEVTLVEAPHHLTIQRGRLSAVNCCCAEPSVAERSDKALRMFDVAGEEDGLSVTLPTANKLFNDELVSLRVLCQLIDRTH